LRDHARAVSISTFSLIATRHRGARLLHIDPPGEWLSERPLPYALQEIAESLSRGELTFDVCCLDEWSASTPLMPGNWMCIKTSAGCRSRAR
jgi:hypothetical protein